MSINLNLGLGNQGIGPIVPVTIGGQAVTKGAVKVAPSVFNGGKNIVNTINKIDDDIGRRIGIAKDNLDIPKK